MRKYFILLALLGPLLANSQVGIGTTTPLSRLHVVDGSVLFSSTGDVVGTPTATPISGAGRRMMWYDEKAAFRAGYVGAVGSNYWNMSNIGNYSFATGSNCLASGVYAFAAGTNANATGEASVALGTYSTASGFRSFTFNGLAYGPGTVSLGTGAQAIGDESMALGNSAVATGFYSTCIGMSVSTGAFSTAIGVSNRAGGQYAVAIGKNAKAGHQGSCVIGDASATFTSDSVYSTTNNQMTMRYVNGYRLYTSQNLSSGMLLSGGGGSWSSVSDVRKKENFKQINKEEILKKVAALPITNWNYKTQPAEQRHIGPMAQDFYAAFHLDGVGNDTTINTVDIDGVNMVSIQALEKRTADLQKENEQLKSQMATMSQRIDAMEKMILEDKGKSKK